MNCIDLFAGCGGLTLGFQNAGIRILSAFDNWKPSIEVYRNNFDHPIHCIDLSDNNLDLTLFRNYNADIIIGGPPCQDFSSAGKRNENLGRADLTKTFGEIVADSYPKYFVMENVERIIKSKTLRETLKILSKKGYHFTQRILDASLCGVPQIRKRYFLIGTTLNVPDNFLDYYLEKNLASKPLTVYEYLGDEINTEFYYRHPRSYNRRGIFSIYEPSPTIRGVNRPIPPNYQKHPGDLCDINKNVRPLTTIERSLIQTFPKKFKFSGAKTDLEQMIGNAVPVKLAEYVGKALLEFISDYESDNPIYNSLNIQTKVFERVRRVYA